MRRASYLAAARRLRHYADLIERYAKSETPRERASLTRAIHDVSSYTRALSERHRRQS